MIDTWYGLLEDDYLIAVVLRFNPPSIFDFQYPISSDYDYKIVELAIYDLQMKRLG